MRWRERGQRVKGSVMGAGWPGRALVFLLPAVAVLTVLRVLAGSYMPGLGSLWDLVASVSVFLAAGVLWRVLSRRLLWRVRTRLVITFLLLGLAPIVLFSVLALSASYLLAGQYATDTALRSLEIAAGEVRSESGGLAMLSMMRAVPSKPPVFNRGAQAPASVAEVALATREGTEWHDLNRGKGGGTPKSPFDGEPSPAWLHAGFQGLVEFHRRLYLCSETEVTQDDHAGLVLASLPLTPATMETMARGLGTMLVLPMQFGTHKLPPRGNHAAVGSGRTKGPEDDLGVDAGQARDGFFESVGAGTLPPARRPLDLPVVFSAPVVIQSWESGAAEPALVYVVSRPSLLYARLFATSVQAGNFIRLGLLTAAAVFVFLELVAVLMAVGLGRTITRSVAELYRGTTEIETGNLLYRIPVRGHDQLAALSTSFNTMSGSMGELMVQQREKERLESELSIAQEVQRNLFPQSPFLSGDLEVHAVCIPARVVSGDYYDFFGGEDQLCLALGDISGKGMSAALLMASLHAAVRSLGLSAEVAAQGGDPSSARLFDLLNRQLFQSTQPERYATLFLAFYDRAHRRMTYTNGGHLAPWVLAADGSCRSLDRGGPVVGLLSGLRYQEAAVDCYPGDLLVAYSDGLTEAENDVEEFGEARLLLFLTTHRDLPLPELAARTLDQVRGWTGGAELTDDRTILLARVG